jgi:hypothetical protein
VLVKDEHTSNNLEKALPKISTAGLFSCIISSATAHHALS